MRFRSGYPSDDGVDAARRQLRDLPRRSFHPELRVENRSIDGPAGPLNIRIYWPPTDHVAPPVILFFHGGGFIVGDLDTHDGTCRQHAVGADAVVVSVDYRLAPEHPYPAAIDDAWAATQWVAEHGDELDADASRLAVAGDSAGGTISAVTAQRSRDNGGPPIRFQLLWYPSTMWDSSLPSFTENADAAILDRDSIAAFCSLLRGRNRPVRSAARNGAGAGGEPGRAATRLHRASPGTTRCATTGSGMANCWRPLVFPSRWTTPRRSCTVTSAMPGWCPPPRPPSTARWPHCVRPCISG